MEPAEQLYRACQTVKPDWNDLGETTRSVWRGYVAKGVTVLDYTPGQYFRPELEKTLLDHVFPMIADKEPEPGMADPEVFVDNTSDLGAAIPHVESGAVIDVQVLPEPAMPDNLHMSLHTSEPASETIVSSGEGYARAALDQPLATWPTVTHSQKPLTLAERLALKKRKP